MRCELQRFSILLLVAVVVPVVVVVVVVVVAHTYVTSLYTAIYYNTHRAAENSIFYEKSMSYLKRAHYIRYARDTQESDPAGAGVAF